MRGRHGGAFGIWWFWHAVLGMLTVTTLVLVTATFVQQHFIQVRAAAEAAKHPVALPAIAAGTAPTTVAFIGDSYTAGAGTTSFHKAWVSLLSDKEGWTLTDLARGGTGYITSPSQPTVACSQAHCPTYGEVIGDAKKLNPTIVFVSGGRNDVGRPDADLRTGIAAFFKNLHAALPKAKIIVSSPVWDSTTPPSQLATIASYVRQDAEQVGAKYLDIGQPLHGHPEDIISDHVHPNDAGHAAIAAAVEAALS